MVSTAAITIIRDIILFAFFSVDLDFVSRLTVSCHSSLQITLFVLPECSMRRSKHAVPLD
jgi:hypothetical protein